MPARSEILIWSAAAAAAVIMGVIFGAAGARLGVALTGSVVALCAVVIARLVWEEQHAPS